MTECRQAPAFEPLDSALVVGLFRLTFGPVTEGNAMSGTTSSIRLPERQGYVLAFINNFSTKHGYPPSIAQITAHFSIGSPNGVVSHLKPLRAKGLIEWIPRQARTLRLTRLGLSVVGRGDA